MQDLLYFSQQLINGLTIGSTYALIAIGYTMVYGIIGMINFAHGEIYMIGAYTALIAITGLADRFGASRIFAVSCTLGALANAGFMAVASQPPLDFLFRFLTGLCLAGIYPLGMKLVIAWTPRYAGAALAWLVGMLTLGTALPHMMRGVTLGLPWEWPLGVASCLAATGGVLVLRLGDGPHLPKISGRLPLRQGLGIVL